MDNFMLMHEFHGISHNLVFESFLAHAPRVLVHDKTLKAGKGDPFSRLLPACRLSS